jgi:hypothetical protein
MKALKTFVFALALSAGSLHAQSNREAVSRQALIYADSLLNAFSYSNWNRYIDMSYPGVIQYYGGIKSFGDHIQRARSISTSQSSFKTELVQLLGNSTNEWQCVVKKTQSTNIDGKNATVISYMIGQSNDGGHSWKYVDVAYNSVANLAYIMPDMFSDLSVPQRQIIFEAFSHTTSPATSL